MYLQCVALLGWVIALGCVSAVIFGTTHENRGHKNSLSVDALYNSLSVLTWSLGVAWIIFACNTGYGGTWISTSLNNNVRNGITFHVFTLVLAVSLINNFHMAEYLCMQTGSASGRHILPLVTKT